MKPDDIAQVIDEQRAALADLLATLEPAQWATPSLCDGWTIREVAVHLTHAHAPRVDMMLAALRAGFRFDAMMFQMALRDTAAPAQIVDRFHVMAGSRRRPPMTKPIDPLMDILIHTQDIGVPLGIDRPMPPQAAAAVANHLWRMRFPLNPQRRLPGVRFVATDTELELGAGRTIEAPVRDIVLTLAGRPSSISADAAPA